MANLDEFASQSGHYLLLTYTRLAARNHKLVSLKEALDVDCITFCNCIVHFQCTIENQSF